MIFIVKLEFSNLADSRLSQIICLGAGAKYITKSQVVRHSTVINTDVNTQGKCVTDASQIQTG